MPADPFLTASTECSSIPCPYGQFRFDVTTCRFRLNGDGAVNNFRIHDNISFKPHSDAKTEMAEKQPKLGCRVMKSMDNQEGSTTDRIGDVSFLPLCQKPICVRERDAQIPRRRSVQYAFLWAFQTPTFVVKIV